MERCKATVHNPELVKFWFGIVAHLNPLHENGKLCVAFINSRSLYPPLTNMNKHISWTTTVFVSDNGGLLGSYKFPKSNRLKGRVLLLNK